MRKLLLSLVALLCATVSFAQTELLTNGGFETWNGDVPAEWHSQKAYSNATVSASTVAHGGSKAVQLVNSTADIKSTANQRIASDVLNLKAGTYTFSAYTKAVEGEAAARLGYAVVEKQADGTYKTTGSSAYKWASNKNGFNGPDTISTEWQKQTYTFTLEATTQLSLCVMHSKNFVAATILLDDASLTTTDGGISTEEVGGSTDTPDTPVIVDAEHISIAEFLQKADVNTTYELTGTVTSISQTTYGNLYIEEDGASVFVYGILDEKGQSKNFASLNVAVGDLLTIQGKYKLYNGTPEIENAQFVSVQKGAAYECEGDGTELNPYTAEDVKHLVGNVDKTEKYWVSGTILGVCLSGSQYTTTIADDANTNLAVGTEESWVPVQLPAGDVRDALNLVDHPSYLGAEVAVYGTLEAYFSVAGVKNVTGYDIDAEDDFTVEDATALTGKYTASTLLCIDDFGTIGDFKNVTVSIEGDKDGNVTITGMTKEPLQGQYVSDTDEGETYYAILFSNAQMLTADEETGMPVEIPAFCEVMDNMLLFDYQMVTENERVAAAFVIREGESVEGAEAYTASVVLANAQTGEDMAPMNTTAYVMELEDEDGKYLALFNICGLPAVIGEYAENGDILIYPSMQWPVILDMANEEDMMCIRLTATDNGYTYTVAVPGYAMFASAYVMTINLTKVGGADAIKNVGEVQNDVIYNLQGQRVNKVQKGIVIKNGKKVLVK